MKVGTFVIVSIVAFTSVYFVATHNRPDPITRDYSQAQWLEMITHSEHQPTTIFEGCRDSYISKRGAGCGGFIIHFQNTSGHVLEHQASDMLEKDPLFFLSALESNDRRVLQTGLYIYDRLFPGNFSNELNVKLGGVYRKLLDHQDTGLRSYAIFRLRYTGQLKVSDIKKGLNDRSGDVRFSTCQCMSSILSNPPVYTIDGKIQKGSAERANELREIKRKLAPVLLNRMNAPRLFTRYEIASEFYSMFYKYELSESGGSTRKLPDSLPPKIDWPRESWHKCEQTRKLLTKWWAENGEDALKFAHPPQK